MRWVPLTAPLIPSYLLGLGSIAAHDPTQVSVRGGRNTIFEVGPPGGPPKFVVKQFGPSDNELASFNREIQVARAAAPPAVEPISVDPDRRALIYPALGESLWRRLTERQQLPQHTPAAVSRALATLQNASLPPAEPPPILQRLAHPTAGRLDLAQRRVLTSLLAAGDAVDHAALNVRREWSAHAGRIHGDLKLEHVLLATDGTIHLIDWELAGAGPPLWDRAGLIQSTLAHAILDGGSWSPSHRDLLMPLLSDVNADVLAPFLATRLWQTALEWTSGRVRPSQQAATLCQLGLNFATDPATISALAQRTKGAR